MAGGDLAAVLQGREDHRLPIEQVVRVAEQVGAGLEHAHARGVVHRDLKPGNIWFDRPGVAQIGDFGLAVALDRSRLTMAGMMVGTASYMPPEQAMGGETTPSSDLYALGCVLYEMVTGRPPFVGDDTVAVISQHVNTPPVAPTWHNAECPPGLEMLILRLLEKDAKKRPASAAQVGEALGSLARGSTPAPQAGAEGPKADLANPIYGRTFVGREQEVKQLEKAFDGALSGQGSLVMIVGEPGIGKTTITEQLATYVGMRGGTLLVGHCYEEGSLSLPYLPFVETMRSYVVQQDREQLSVQLGTGAADVARIVSEVRDRVTVEPSAASSPEEERFRLFQAVTSFLRNASNVQALCLVLEDLRDADKGTLEMLVHLARNLAGARILLVGTYRDVEVDRTHPLSGTLAEVRRVESFQRIPLRGLSPDEVHRMISNIAGQDIPFVLTEGVYRQTEGNPLFIQEVFRYVAESGLITREGDQWVAAGGAESLLAQIPEGLKDVIGRRLSGLSEDCNRVLSVASVIGRDFAVDVLQRVGGITEDQLLSALEEAMRVSLIEDMKAGREARYRFTHAFFRQTLYEEMIAPRRLRMHNEVAKALEQHYAGRLDEHAAELAEHFSHSSTEEDLRKAVEYGELAATRSASVFAYGEAARYLEQALEVQEVLDANDGETRLELLMKLNTALLSAGKPERILTAVATTAFELAVALGRDTDAARVAETAIWALIYQQGTIAFVTPDFRVWCERMDAHAAPGTAERVIADCFRSWTLWNSRGREEECWRLRRKALDLARQLGDARALAFAVSCFVFEGGPQKWDADRLAVAQELRDLPRTGLPPNVHAFLLHSLAQTQLGGGDRAAAERCWDELDAYAARVPDPYMHSWQVFGAVYRLKLRGELEHAVHVSEELAANASALGIELWGRLVATWAPSTALMDLGRHEEVIAGHWAWGAVPNGAALVADSLALAARTEAARDNVNVAEVTTTQRYALTAGMRVTVTGAAPAAYNCAQCPITVISPTQFEYTIVGLPGAAINQGTANFTDNPIAIVKGDGNGYLNGGLPGMTTSASGQDFDDSDICKVAYAINGAPNPPTICLAFRAIDKPPGPGYVWQDSNNDGTPDFLCEGTCTSGNVLRDHKGDANGDGYSDADEGTPANCGAASCGSIITLGTAETNSCRNAGRNCGSGVATQWDPLVRAKDAVAPGTGCLKTLDQITSLKTTNLAKSDVDLDGVVSILDLSKIASWFGNPVGDSTDPRWEGNMDGDGSISILDLSAAAANYGRSVNGNCAVQ
jgi:tetratricopeptide (TPR) repeat protein